MRNKTDNNHGFSLIELIIIIVVISIFFSLALQSMTALLTSAKEVKTEREMEELLTGLVGTTVTGGNATGSDFGYVGDVGSFPANLSALTANPGSYSTWEGPYIEKFNEDPDGYLKDEWGQTYSYNGSTTVTTNSSGTTITKSLPGSAADYLLNSYTGAIRDINDSTPGIIYNDSIDIEIVYPSGSGSTSTKTYHPQSDGSFTLDSLPIGQHLLRIIYQPDYDTLKTYATIYPRNNNFRIFKLTSNYFSASGGGGGGGGGGSGSSGVEILYPDGSGSSSQLNDENCHHNWQCVNETTPDDNGTYVKGSGNGWNEDLYSTQDHSTGSGTIDSVKIYIRSTGSSSMKAKTYLRTNHQNFEGNQINLSSSYSNYSTTYINNPATGSAWSWSEIDNIEIGTSIKKEGRVTQVYLEVYYTY